VFLNNKNISPKIWLFKKKRVSLHQVFLVVNLVLVFKPWVM